MKTNTILTTAALAGMMFLGQGAMAHQPRRIAHAGELEPLQLEDAAATLVAFMAEAVKLGFDVMGERPTELVVCGGGRHNPEIMKALAERLPMPVRTAEDHGWRGDAIEAEACAYLAARTAKGLPISFPKTTGVPKPMTSGTIARP